MKVIEVEDVSKRFGGIQALDGVTLSLHSGEIYGLIGPNGSGKTTLINVISGFHDTDSGSVKINGVKVNGLPPYAYPYRGLARTFQTPKLWSRLSVLENLLVASYGKRGSLIQKDIKNRIEEFLEYFEMSRISKLSASKISFGQAKLLEFGRAVLSGAKIILLDEPFAGVSPSIIPRQIKLIKSLQANGFAFLIVSHIISTITEVSDKVGVMNEGKLIAEGKAEEVLELKDVIEAYLGGVRVTSS